jgi:hypothetical protein
MRGTVQRRLIGRVIYSMGVSLDGCIVRPDGGFDWTVPDEEVFGFVTDGYERPASTCWDEDRTRRLGLSSPTSRFSSVDLLRPHHRDRLTGRHGQADVVQRRHTARGVAFGRFAQLD